MARPKPKILVSHSNAKTYKVEEVLEADGIYAVFYDGKPINLKLVHGLINYPSPKYKKTSFANSGHAFNLRDRLNIQFKTDKFQVYKLSHGTKI